MNVRRLAAIDMYGAQGTTRRRRIILAEFLVVVVVMVAFGIWLTAYASGLGGRMLGIWMIGAGLNYAPLAAYEIALSLARAHSALSWPVWTPAGNCAATASSSYGYSCPFRSSSSPCTPQLSGMPSVVRCCG